MRRRGRDAQILSYCITPLMASATQFIGASGAVLAFSEVILSDIEDCFDYHLPYYVWDF